MESDVEWQKQEELDKAEDANKIYFEYLEKLKQNDSIDLDYHCKVLSVDKYSGTAIAFKNGVEVKFEDGTFALKGGFMMRRFSSKAELDKWGSSPAQPDCG